MERKDPFVMLVAFAAGAVAGTVLTSIRNLSRWVQLDQTRTDEGHDLLTTYLDAEFSKLNNTMTTFRTRLDEVAVLAGDRRGKGGVTTLPPPRDGG